MDNPKWSRVVGFSIMVAVGLGLALLVKTLDPRQSQIYYVAIAAFLVVVIPAFVVLTILFFRTSNVGKESRHLSSSIALIHGGHAPTVINQALAQRRAGDRSPENAIVLAMAYTYQGRGEKGEEFALEALDLLVGEHASGWLRDLARIALFNALLARGAFSDAAESLATYTSTSFDEAFMSLLTAWGWYLAGQDDAARRILAELPANQSLQRRISPRYILMLVHMRHTLCGEPPPNLDRFREALDEWDQEAGRSAQESYGIRLREVLADIHAAQTGV